MNLAPGIAIEHQISHHQDLRVVISARLCLSSVSLEGLIRVWQGILQSDFQKH